MTMCELCLMGLDSHDFSEGQPYKMLCEHEFEEGYPCLDSARDEFNDIMAFTADTNPPLYLTIAKWIADIKMRFPRARKL